MRVGVAVREWTSPTLRDTRRLSGFVTRARKDAPISTSEDVFTEHQQTQRQPRSRRAPTLTPWPAAHPLAAAVDKASRPLGRLGRLRRSVTLRLA